MSNNTTFFADEIAAAGYTTILDGLRAYIRGELQLSRNAAYTAEKLIEELGACAAPRYHTPNGAPIYA